MQWSKWDSPAQKATVPHHDTWPPAHCNDLPTALTLQHGIMSARDVSAPRNICLSLAFVRWTMSSSSFYVFFPLVYCSESYFYTEWVHVICLQLPVCNAHFRFAQGTYLPCITQEFEHCPVLNRFTHSHGSCDTRCMTPTLQRGNWRTQKQMNEPKMWQTVKLERGTPSDLPQVSSYLPIFPLIFTSLENTTQLIHQRVSWITGEMESECSHILQNHGAILYSAMLNKLNRASPCCHIKAFFPQDEAKSSLVFNT